METKKNLKELIQSYATKNSAPDFPSPPLKAELSIEEMASHIAQLKRPRLHSLRNPLSGNSLY